MSDTKTQKTSSFKKNTWSLSEDEILISIVNKYGAKSWSFVAGHLPKRTGKQCRERWHNHVKPEIKKVPWRAEEDEKLKYLAAVHGQRWALIGKHLPGRSDNSVKNRFKSLCKKKQILEIPSSIAHSSKQSSLPSISALNSCLEEHLKTSHSNAAGDLSDSDSSDSSEINEGTEFKEQLKQENKNTITPTTTTNAAPTTTFPSYQTHQNNSSSSSSTSSSSSPLLPSLSQLFPVVHQNQPFSQPFSPQLSLLSRYATELACEKYNQISHSQQQQQQSNFSNDPLQAFRLCSTNQFFRFPDSVSFPM